MDTSTPSACMMATLADVVGAVAADIGPLALGIADLPNHLQLAGVIVKLGLDIGEAVDAADDLGNVLAQAVEDDPQGALRALLAFFTMPMAPSAAAEGLVTGQEGKKHALVAEQHSAQVAVAQTHLAVVGHGAVDAGDRRPTPIIWRARRS